MLQAGKFKINAPIFEVTWYTEMCRLWALTGQEKQKDTQCPVLLPNINLVYETRALQLPKDPTFNIVLLGIKFQYKIRTGTNLGVIASWTKSGGLLFCSQRRTEWARRWVGRIGCGEVPSSPSWQCLSRRTPRWWMGKLNASHSQRLSYYTRLGESKIGAQNGLLLRQDFQRVWCPRW